MACERQTMQQLAVYSLDGTSYLGRIESAGFDIDLSTSDGGSGAASREDHVELKRTSRHDFTLKVENGSGAPMTSAQIATETVGGSSLVGIAKTFTIGTSIRNNDGSGHGNLDTCPVAIRSVVTASVRKMIPLNVPVDTWFSWANSNTPTDRQKEVSINFGAKTVTFPGLLRKVKKTTSEGELDMIDAEFVQRGALTAPSSGTDIYMVAFAGDARVSLIANKNYDGGNMTYSADGNIESLVVTVEDGQIVKAVGQVWIEGPFTLTDDPDA